MVNKHKIFMMIATLYTIGISTIGYACMTTFINDSSTKIGIFNEFDRIFTCIAKNVKRRFGHPDRQAHFTVYVQQPKTKSEIWAPIYTCQQKKCSSDGSIVLKFSDLQNGVDVNNLFTIKKCQPYSSMVKTLSIMKN
jgi:hypothetical protein